MIPNSVAGAVLLAILGWVNYRVSGTLRYPAALFSCWWSLVLLAVGVSGNAFYPISEATLAVYIIGPLAMSAGGLMVLALNSREAKGPVVAWECRDGLLTAAIVILALAFPMLWWRISELSASSGVRDFWVGVRYQTMRPERAGNSMGLYQYLIFFSTIGALVAFEDAQRRKRHAGRAAVAVMMSLTYHLVTASRLGALIVTAGLAGIALLHSRRIVMTVLASGLAAAFVFTSVALALKKSGGGGGDLVAEVGAVAQSFRLYALGGVVAFDNVVEGRTVSNAEGRTYRVVYAAARALGYEVDVPPLVSQYSDTPVQTNVYTIYYPYLVDWGKAGVAVLFFGFGALFGSVFLQARNAPGPFSVVYGLVFAYLLLSSADEYFFSLLSMNLQAVGYLLLLYRRGRPKVLNAVHA